jgi:hypothetical protein
MLRVLQKGGFTTVKYDHGYTFNRTVNGAGYDINGADRINTLGEQVPVSEEIEAALPGKNFFIHCAGVECCIEFENELTAPEESTLDSVIAAHILNASPVQA